MMIRKTSFLLVVFLCGAFSVLAQTDSLKYGHMNMGNLLTEMPETAEAEAQLRVLADSLNLQDSLMTIEFQTAYLELKNEYDSGSLTPVQVQEKQAILEKQRQGIQKYEEEAQQILEDARNKLLRPILERIDSAIKEVAQANGFLMIFDVSAGAMLFASETIDVAPMVKKKLGL